MKKEFYIPTHPEDLLLSNDHYFVIDKFDVEIISENNLNNLLDSIFFLKKKNIYH